MLLGIYLKNFEIYLDKELFNSDLILKINDLYDLNNYA